jgi:hypothetical protein
MITFDDIDFMHVMLDVGTVKTCSDGESNDGRRTATNG